MGLGWQYTGDELGTFDGSFYGNYTSYYITGSLFNAMAAYIAAGNNSFTIYNTSGTIITNPGSVYSEPILTVTGSGNITLMVGMAIVELENISGSIVIDSVLQEAYQGTTLMNDHMNGEFPVLKPGANAISWTGTVTKVVVRPNWRSL